MVGVGLMVGPHTGLGLLIGAICAWGMIAPWLVNQGIANADYSSLAGWLAWPGVGLMVGTAGGAVSLGRGHPLSGGRDVSLFAPPEERPEMQPYQFVRPALEAGVTRVFLIQTSAVHLAGALW